MNSQPITIIGGGIAGLSLGIGLRRHDVRVILWEAGQYPRHRVCGEFISGRGQQVLSQLGLNQALEEAGAVEVRTARFVAGDHRSPVRSLPPAIGISRHDLDALLAREFERLGGRLQFGRAKTTSAECVVRATGRRAQTRDDGGWRWFGLKAHARQVNLNADLEMHLSRNSYVGVNRINRGEINVCGLFRARRSEPVENRLERLRGEPGSALHRLLGTAVLDPTSFCSVAGLCLAPQRAARRDEFCIGDALTLIPPATGNGMSMALESAFLSLEPLVAFSRGEISWSEARDRAARACDAAFATRLRWARVLQRLLFLPLTRQRAGAWLLRSDLLWNLFFQRTR